MDKEFFFENSKGDLEKRINKENEYAVIYVELLLKNHRRMFSNLIGIAILNNDVALGCIKEKGEALFTISYLSVHYNIVMEERGFIKKIYVENFQIVMFKTPLILMELL